MPIQGHLLYERKTTMTKIETDKVKKEIMAYIRGALGPLVLEVQ